MLRGCFLLLGILFLIVTVLLGHGGAWCDAATTGILSFVFSLLVVFGDWEWERPWLKATQSARGRRCCCNGIKFSA